MSRKKVKGALNQDEIDAIQEYFKENFENVTMKPVYYGMFVFGLNTGLRVSELTGLNINDVWNIKQEEPKTNLIVRAETAKGDKQRTVPLNKKAQDVIKRLISFYENKDYPVEDESPLFRSRQKNSEGERRISPRSFQNKLKTINDDLWEQGKLNIDLTPHTLRRTFGTKVYEKTDGDIRAVQDLLGHSDVSTTQVYIKITRDKKREAVEKLDEM